MKEPAPPFSFFFYCYCYGETDPLRRSSSQQSVDFHLQTCPPLKLTHAAKDRQLVRLMARKHGVEKLLMVFKLIIGQSRCNQQRYLRLLHSRSSNRRALEEAEMNWFKDNTLKIYIWLHVINRVPREILGDDKKEKECIKRVVGCLYPRFRRRYYVTNMHDLFQKLLSSV